MQISGVDLVLDVEKYICSLGLKGIKVSGHNIMACCPFHQDHRPSFGINVHSGLWQCFGCGRKGHFALLVKELEHFDTVYDAEQYLIQRFGRFRSILIDEPLELSFDEKDPTYYIPDDALDPYKYRHPYLTKRGISEKIQRFFEVGYSYQHRAITIPWRDHAGRLLTVKMRRTYTKAFWFDPPMPPRIKASTLWGLNKVLTNRTEMVAITEGEIDAMTLWQAGVPAVALGGNLLTPEQAGRLRNLLPLDTNILIFTDHDQGGERAKQSIINQLATDFPIFQVRWDQLDENFKDANDLSSEQISFLVRTKQPCGLCITQR